MTRIDICILISLTLLLSAFVEAQEQKQPHCEYDNHIGIAVGVVPLFAEKEIATGLHLDYVHKLPFKDGLLGFGGGVEVILDEHRHIGAFAILSLSPFEDFSINASPGIQFGENEQCFSMHFEAVYEFEFKHIHIGPVIGYAFSEDDNHMMIGIHIGKGF